jgi:hypothetical protein
MSHIFKSRSRLEAEVSESHATRNRVGASTLTDLLEQRKSLASRDELGRVAGLCGMDLAKLESVARYANSPSIGEGTTVKRIGEDGEELITMSVCGHFEESMAWLMIIVLQAVWVEPSRNVPNPRLLER